MTKNLRLKESRIKAGLNQEQFAEKLGVKTSYVTMLENGKGFSFKKAQELAKLLGVDAEWLYFDDKENTQKNIKGTLSHNPETKSDPMQSRELIEMQKKVIEMQEAEINRLKEELEKLHDAIKHENPVKGNSHASSGR